MTFSWVARALSGSPFNLFNGDTDPDLNGNVNEPLPAGTYRGVGEDAYEVEAEQQRNGAYGPRFFQLDVRFGYRLRLGGDRTLDLFGEVFNLTNEVNFGNPSGNLAAPSFLLLTGYRDGAVPRTGQVGVRLGF